MTLSGLLTRIATLAALTAATVGCDSVFNHLAENNLDPNNAELTVNGISADVQIRRDNYGVPYIEAGNMGDLAFGIGYAMAQDRLAEMVG